MFDVMQESSRTWLLGKGSIGGMSVGCHCRLLTVEFMFGDRIRLLRVDLLLNMINLPFKMVENW